MRLPVSSPVPSTRPASTAAEDGFRSLNLIDDKTELKPFDASRLAGATVRPYPTEAPIELRPGLFVAALALFAADALAVLLLNGGLALRRRAVGGHARPRRCRS